MKMSRKQGAEEARSTYINDLNEKGILLIRSVDTREVVFLTVSGKIVRMPFANEKTKGDEWWWGLSDKEAFDFIVLLGKRHTGEWLDFVLPYSFISPLWDSLSRDKQGGVNFEIDRRSHGDYRLVLKGGRLKPINEYLGAVESLRDAISPS
jgi:hypothetical protein